MKVEPGLGAPFPVVHVVSDDATLSRPDFSAVAGALLSVGAGRVAVHLRAHGVGGGAMERLARAVDAQAPDGAWLVVNDRIDVAGAVAARGIQIGRRSLPLPVVRRLASDALVGYSVHSIESARAAAAADWLVLGTIYETASHPGRPAAGPVHVGRVARVVDCPVVAIGGILPTHLPRLREEGAAGVAVLSGIWGAVDPVAALGDYLSAWERAA